MIWFCKHPNKFTHTHTQRCLQWFILVGRVRVEFCFIFYPSRWFYNLSRMCGESQWRDLFPSQPPSLSCDPSPAVFLQCPVYGWGRAGAGLFLSSKPSLTSHSPRLTGPLCTFPHQQLQNQTGGSVASASALAGNRLGKAAMGSAPLQGPFLPLGCLRP